MGGYLADLLDDLIAEGAKNLPKRNIPGEPFVVRRSPIESESDFLGMAAWFDHITCSKCGCFELRFDGLYEERKFKLNGIKHWLRCTVIPFNMTRKVSYVRKHKIPFCAECLDAHAWPTVHESEMDATKDYTTCLVPNR